MRRMIPMGRSVRFQKGHHREPDPNHPYDRGSCGGMSLYFLYRGKKGVTQFVVFTDWIPWEPRPTSSNAYIGPEYRNRPRESVSPMYPMAADLGYHSPKRVWQDQPSRECDVLPQKRCYYDGSGLNAQPVLVEFLYDGEEAMWKRLEDYYQKVFETP